MGSKSANETAEYTFMLNETISLTTVNNFYHDLKKLLHTPSTIIVDTSSVKCLDTAALQLLCCWYQDTMQRGIKVQWRNIGGVFYDSVKRLGLLEQLHIEA